MIGGEELGFEVCVAKAVDLPSIGANEELVSLSTQGNRCHTSLQLRVPVRVTMTSMSIRMLSELPPQLNESSFASLTRKWVL